LIQQLESVDISCDFNLIEDPALLVPTPLKDLKYQKAYFKVISKRDKELESLSKKHEKVGVMSQYNKKLKQMEMFASLIASYDEMTIISKISIHM
jgi:hypothetical protein